MSEDDWLKSPNSIFENEKFNSTNKLINGFGIVKNVKVYEEIIAF